MKLIARTLAFVMLLIACAAVDIKPLALTVTNKIISSPNVNYTFFISRGWDGNGGQIFNPEDISPGGTINITFPPQYTSISQYKIAKIQYNKRQDANLTDCSNSNISVDSITNTIIISGCFITTTSVYTLSVTLSNITNPSPAIQVGPFKATLGNDSTSTNDTEHISYVTLDPFDIQDCSITYSNNIINSSSVVTVNFTPTHLIPKNTGRIYIEFPTSGYWTNSLSTYLKFYSNPSSCTSSLQSGIACTFLQNSTLVVYNLFSNDTSTSFSFNISSVITPPSPQQIDNLFIYSSNGPNRLDRCKQSAVGQGLIAKQINISITPNDTMYVNKLFSLQIQSSFTQFFISNSNWTFQLIFPQGSILINNSISTSTMGNPNLLTVLNKSIVAWNFAGTSNATRSSFIIYYKSYQAPTTTNPSVTIGLNISRNNVPVMYGYDTLTVVAGNLSAAVTFSPQNVNTLSTYNFSITINDPISSTGCIQIDFPSTLTLNNSVCSAVGAPNITCNPTSSSMKACNFSSGQATVSPQTINLIITNVKNPKSMKKTDNFSITTYYTANASSLVAKGTSFGISAINNGLAIDTVTVSSSNSQTYATSVSYTIKFSNLDPIPPNGWILLGIPLDVQITSSPSCNLSIANNVVLSNCGQIVNSSGIFLTFKNISNQQISANSSIQISLSNVFRNPPTTQQTSSTSFGIQTYDYYDSSDQNFLIDSLTSGIYPPISASQLSVSINQADPTNSAITSYTFNCSQAPPIVANSTLIITFPSTIVPQNSIACKDALGTNLSCNSNQQKVTIVLQAIESNHGFSITISNIKNAPSFKKSSTFNISSQTSSNFYYSKNQAEVVVTNTIASKINASSISGTFSPKTLGTPTTLTLNFTPTIDVDSIIVTLAESFVIGTISCNPPCNPIGRNVTINGTFKSSTSNLVNISGFNSSSSTPSDQSSVYTFQTDIFLVDSNPNSIQYGTNCTFPCKQCSGTLDNCTSCYTDIGTYNYLDAVNHKCVSQCPTHYYVSNFKCEICSLQCKNCTGSASNCTSCSNSSNFPFFNKTQSSGTCLASCPPGMYADNSTSQSTCVVCSSPCLTCSSGPLICDSCISGTFLYNKTCNTSCPSDKKTVPNTQTNNCDPCTANCVTCENTTSTCLSCPTTGDYVLYNKQCRTTCPFPMIKYEGTCVSCNPVCATCSGNPSNCTSCSTNYLFQNNCIANCPINYAGINNVCYKCDPTCRTCVNSTSICTSCLSPYYYVPSRNTCQNPCPSGLYLNASNNTCVPCSPPCNTCVDTPTNCVTCLSGYLMLNSQCIESCPNGTFSNGTHCIASSNNTDVINRTLTGKLFPLPFTLAGTVVILATGISKFQNSNTFFSGATYALLSLLQWGSFVIFGLFYYLSVKTFDTIFIVIIGVMALLYIVNFISVIVYFCILSKDLQFDTWKSKKCIHKNTAVFGYLFSAIFSFKFMNILFCKLYNFSIFKAKLDGISKFFGFNFLIFLSTPFSLGALCVAAYIAYINSNNIDQLYLQTIDLIIIVVFTFIFGIATSHKTEDFFEEKNGDVTLGKKSQDNDDLSSINQPLRPGGSFNERGGKSEKYAFYDVDASQPSYMDLKGDTSNLQFQSQEINTGTESYMRRPVGRTNRKNIQDSTQKIVEQEEPEFMFSQQNEQQSSIQQEEKKYTDKSVSAIQLFNEVGNKQPSQENEKVQQKVSELSKGNEDQVLYFQEKNHDTSQQDQIGNDLNQNVIKQDQQLEIDRQIITEDQQELGLEDKTNAPENFKKQKNQQILHGQQLQDPQHKQDQIKIIKGSQNEGNSKAAMLNKLQQMKTQNMNSFDKTSEIFKQKTQNQIYEQQDIQIIKQDQVLEDNVYESQEDAKQYENFQSQNLKSDVQKDKATIKTKGLDTSKDQYMTDRGQFQIKDILSDQQSDFKFGAKSNRRDNKFKNYSEAEEEVPKQIQQEEEQQDKNILLYEDMNQIDQSLPEGELSIQKHPYHVVPLKNRRKPDQEIGSRTLNIGRRQQSFKVLQNISGIPGSNIRDKRPPDEEPDGKTPEIISDQNKKQGELGHSIINKHPPNNPMLSIKKDKRQMNQLLMSSSQFTQSQSQSQLPAYRRVEPLIKDNLTQISKEIESVKQAKKQKLSPTKKYKVVYDTSDVMDEDSVQFGDIGISPSDFNHYNQRFVEQQFDYKTSTNPLSRNDIPLKPQVMMVRSKQSIFDKSSIQRSIQKQEPSFDLNVNDEPQIGRVIHKPMSAIERSPLLLRGFSSQGVKRRNYEQDSFRDRRTIEPQNRSKGKQIKVNRDLQKIYLQRLDVSSKSKDK